MVVKATFKVVATIVIFSLDALIDVKHHLENAINCELLKLLLLTILVIVIDLFVTAIKRIIAF
jgi:hypothetical protein